MQRPIEPSPARTTRASRTTQSTPPRPDAYVIEPSDARWLLAARVALALDGGRAGLLTPEQRDAVLRFAGRLGVRPFDAHVIIALVQDRARRGEPALGGELAEQLLLVSPVGGPAASGGATGAEATAAGSGGVLPMAAGMGAVLALLMILWTAGAL